MAPLGEIVLVNVDGVNLVTVVDSTIPVGWVLAIADISEICNVDSLLRLCRPALACLSL